MKLNLIITYYIPVTLFNYIDLILWCLPMLKCELLFSQIQYLRPRKNTFPQTDIKRSYEC